MSEDTSQGLLLSIFVSYSHRDRRWIDGEDDFVPYLERSLKRQNVELWYDPRIESGEEWKTRILEEIDRASIAILLISQDFLNSQFIADVECRRIEARVRSGDLRIIPILVSPCSWQSCPLLKDRQMLPGGPTPLINYKRDAASWEHLRFEILSAIQRHVDEIRRGSEGGRPPPVIPAKPVLPTHPGSGSRFRSRRVIVLVGILLAVGLVVAAYLLHIRGVPDTDEAERRASFFGAMPWLNWILYDPTDYDPYRNKEASLGSIRKDLQVLRRHGFNGLITMNSVGSNSHIAQIAKEVGFQKVIVGIYDFTQDDELANAIAASTFADAYCVGHRSLEQGRSLSAVEHLLEHVRRRTSRLVTTTEVLAEYETNAALVRLGDFLCPDVHCQWYDDMTPADAWARTVAKARAAALLVKDLPDKRVLLKMISFPSSGSKGLTPETQVEFYRMAVERARDSTDLPSRISLSFFAAFDPVWKTGEYGWASSERHTGLFDEKRNPKPAVSEVDWESKRR